MQKKLTAMERATAIARTLPSRFESTSEAITAFDQMVREANLSHPVNRRAPGGAVGKVVYPLARAPRTQEEAKLVEEMRHGYDPNTNQRFETVTEGREYLKRNHIEQMRASDFLKQFGGIDQGGLTSTKSSSRQPLDTNVKGFNPDAFEIGAMAAQAIGMGKK